MSDMNAQHSFKRWFGFALILDIIILDQLSKWGVLEYIIRPNIDGAGEPIGLFKWLAEAPARLPSVSVDTPLPFFNWVMVWNEGISFGMKPASDPLVLIGLALIICVMFVFWLTKAESWGQALAIGAVIGGALGNVIDRIRFGAVADFLDFHIGNWHYPAFNIADSCITLGILFLIFDGVVLEPKRKKANLKT